MKTVWRTDEEIQGGKGRPPSLKFLFPLVRQWVSRTLRGRALAPGETRLEFLKADPPPSTPPIAPLLFPSLRLPGTEANFINNSKHHLTTCSIRAALLVCGQVCRGKDEAFVCVHQGSEETCRGDTLKAKNNQITIDNKIVLFVCESSGAVQTLLLWAGLFAALLSPFGFCMKFPLLTPEQWAHDPVTAPRATRSCRQESAAGWRVSRPSMLTGATATWKSILKSVQHPCVSETTHYWTPDTPAVAQTWGLSIIRCYSSTAMLFSWVFSSSQNTLIVPILVFFHYFKKKKPWNMNSTATPQVTN